MKGANAPGSSPQAGGAGRCAKPTGLLGLQPGSAPNSENPSPLYLRIREGAQASLSRPGGPAPCGIAARRRGSRGGQGRREGERACATSPRCRARSSGQRERLLAAPPLNPTYQRATNAGKGNNSMLRDENWCLFTTLRDRPPRARRGKKVVRKTGRPGGTAPRLSQPGPNSYPSRAGAVAAASAPSAASASSAARSAASWVSMSLPDTTALGGGGRGTPPKKLDKSLESRLQRPAPTCRLARAQLSPTASAAAASARIRAWLWHQEIITGARGDVTGHRSAAASRGVLENCRGPCARTHARARACGPHCAGASLEPSRIPPKCSWAHRDALKRP